MTPHPDKVLSVAAARQQVVQLQEHGKRVVFTCGCFDVLHVGHVRSLQAARDLGDFLLIGLNTDESVRALKGEGRPFFTVEERAEVLAALDMVDGIVFVADLTMDRVLEQVRPHIYAKGTDYTLETIPERDTVLAYGGQLAIVGDPKTRSSRQFTLQRQSPAPQAAPHAAEPHTAEPHPTHPHTTHPHTTLPRESRE